MEILVIDNYDSFTFNLVQLLGKNRNKVVVKKNDELDEEKLYEINPDKILISPGPGKPEDSKASLTAIKLFAGKLPILGVCLGHQAIAICYGGRVIKSPQLMHGKTSSIIHIGKGVFNGLPQNLPATRYHSLIVEKETLPSVLEITAETEDGLIMGLRHKQLAVEGIQFHPESILTPTGEKMLQNWLKL